jgi:hypothetical protein
VKTLGAVLAASLKGWRRDSVPIELSISEEEPNRLKASMHGKDLITVDLEPDSDFPKVLKLFPDETNAGLPDGIITFNPRYLSLLAKLPKPRTAASSCASTVRSP